MKTGQSPPDEEETSSNRDVVLLTNFENLMNEEVLKKIGTGGNFLLPIRKRILGTYIHERRL